MDKISLGNLEKVDLREVFPSESGDFTPWLAREDNLQKLGEALDLELQLETQEKNIGPFRADILCKDVNTQNWVLIENQIERTDHNHLGQLMTYAAGLNAVTIIWIASHFTDEHRAALDWLNEITDNEINFFGIEIELWKIGNSETASKFNVVCKPNLWTHTVSQAAHDIENRDLTDTQKLQLEYWANLNKFMKIHQSLVRPTKPLPQHWMNFAIGRANFVLIALTNRKEKRIGVGLILSGPNSKAHFHLLLNEKDVIEKEFGRPLEWNELPDRTESHIYLYRDNSSLDIAGRWDEYSGWMTENLEKLSTVFKNRVKNFDADDYVPPDNAGVQKLIFMGDHLSR